MPDLLRARALILSAAHTPDFPTVESDLLQSIALARQQSSPGWELRTAIPLARFWLGAGRAVEAGRLLHDVLEAFSEGIDDPDIQTAKALIAASGHK